MPKEKNTTSQLLSINEVALLLKVSTKTLRRWEEKGVLIPERTEGKHRRYAYEAIVSFKKSKGNAKKATQTVKTTPTPITPRVAETPQVLNEETLAAPAIPLAQVQESVVESGTSTSANIDQVYQAITHTNVQSEEYTPVRKNNRTPYRSLASYALLSFGILIGLATIISAATGFRSYLSSTSTSNADDALNRGARSEERDSQVLADKSVLQDLKFTLNVPTEINNDILIAGNATTSGLLTVGTNLTVNNNITVAGQTNTIAGTLTLSGNRLAAPGDLTIAAAGGAVRIGTTGTPTIDLSGGDLYISDQIELGTSLTLAGDTISDFTGTGLSVSSGSLQTTLGTSIDSSEISDGSIQEVDLKATNDASGGQLLSYDSSSGGFTWVSAASTGPWQTTSNVANLITATDDVSIGAATDLGKLGVIGDSNEIQMVVRGNSTQTANLLELQQSSGTTVFTVDNSGNTTLSGTLSVNSQAFSDLTGNGLTLSSGALTILPAPSADGLSSTTSTGSGLEVLSTGIALLQGCSTGQVLKWNEINDAWECANDTGGAAAIVNVENNDAAVGSSVDTIDFSTDFSVTASPTSEANVSIASNVISATHLAATLTFSDGDFLDLSGINNSSTTEGIRLPQSTSCASGTAEGQLCWDTDGDFLVAGTGSTTVSILSSGSSLFTAAGDSGSSQSISAGDTLTIAGGTNGIDTVGTATDIVTLNLDTTEIGSTTFGSGSAITWTFDASVGTDPTIVFGDNAITLNAATTTLSGDLAVNGGDITTSASTATIFNTNATTVNIGGAATTMSIGASGGTTTFPSNVTITGNLTTAASNFAADGATTLSPSGTNDVTFNLDSDSTFILNGIQSGTASSALCLDGSNNVITCQTAITITMQNAYDNDADGSNVIVALSTGDDSLIFRNPASSGTDSGYIQLYDQLNSGNVDAIQIANAGTGDSIQIANSSTGSFLNISASGAGTTADGIVIAQTSSGAITDALDLSDAEIVNAINVGANVIIGTTGDIDYTNFDVAGSTGNVTAAGDLAANGGNITTTSGTATLFNSNATNLSIGGAATTLSLGAGSGTTTVNNGLTVTGSLTANGTFTLGDNGDAGSIDTNDWDISTTGTLSGIGGITADGGISFTPSSTNDITFTTDSDSTFVLSGLQSASGTALCVDGSNNVVTCAAGSTVTGTGAANRIAYWSSASALTSSTSFTFDPAATTGNTFLVTNTGLTTGTLTSFTGTNTAATNTALTQNLFDVTNAQATNANTNGMVGLGVNFTNNPSVAGNTEYAVQVQNQVTANTTDNAVAALLRLNNADTSATGSTVVTDGLRIENTGNIAGGIVTAINIADSDITTDLSLQNGETIDNNTDGTITLTATTTQTSGGVTVAGSTGVTLSDVTADITFGNGESINNDTNGRISVANADLAISSTTGDLLFGNGESINNDTDGRITVVNADFAISSVTGDLLFGNAESINNDTDGTLALVATTTTTSGDLSVLGGDLTLGQNGTDGTLTLYNELGATDRSIIFQTSASQSQDVTYTLPPDDGTSNYVLVTDGAGVLTWQSASGIGAGGDITAVGSMITGDAFADATADDDWLGLGVAAGRIEFDDQATDEVNILSASVGIGTQTPATQLHVAGSTGVTIGLDVAGGSNNTAAALDLISAGDNAFSTLFQTATQTQDITYTLPPDDGSTDYVLSTDGAGVLTWKSASGVGAGSGDITTVGSMVTGDTFSDSSADDDWLGLGASAGRIEFDDQTIDEVNILAANFAIGDSTPDGTFDIDSTGLTTGRGVDWTITNTATADSAITQALFNFTNAQATAANSNFVGLAVNFTNNPTIAGNTEYAARIQNQATTNTTDNAVRALLLLDNADTSGTGSTVVTDGLLITNSGDIAGGITNGINIDDVDVTTDIVLQNDETIDNNTDGTITVTAANTSLSGDLAIGGGNITTAFTADSTVTVTGTLTANGTLNANGQFTLGDNGDTGSVNTSDWDISATGDLTGIGGITADGAISLTPGSTNDITFTTDSDSTLILSGLQSGTGNALCVDGSNNVVTCTVGSGGIAGSGTSGQIAYFNGTGTITSEASGFGWDATNDRFTISSTNTTGVTASFTDTALTTGKLSSFTGTSTAASNTAVQQNLFDVTFAQSTAANTNGFTGLALNFTSNPTIAGNTEYAARIQNQVTTNTTDNAISALLFLDNADTSGTGSTVVSDAIRITNSGDIASGISVGLNIADADIATDISLQNGETIDNNTDGTITLTAGTVTASSNVTVTGDLTITGNDITFGNAETISNATDGDITITPASTGSLNVLTGNLKIGNGTPDVTQNGEDGYVEGTFEVDGATRFDGTTTQNGTLNANGQFTLGDNGDTGAINTSDWDISTTGDLTGIGGITADGAISITPSSTNDITFTLDADSTLILSGLQSGSGTALCVDGSSNIVTCSSGSSVSGSGSANRVAYWSGASTLTSSANFTFDPTATTTDTYVVTNTGLTTGTLTKFTGTNTAATNTALTQNLFDVTNAQATNANTLGVVGVGINFTNNPTIAGNTEYALQIQNQVTTNTTDNVVAALLRIDNADTSGTGSTVVTDAIRIENTGNIASGITNAINIADADIVTDIVLQNAETIDNNTDGTITLTAANTSLSGDLGISGGNITTAFTADSTVTVTGTLTANGTLAANNTFTLGDNGDTGAVNTSDWDITTTGDLTGIGAITADGAIAFTPGSTNDITFTLDADTTLVLSGVQSGTAANGLCLDGTNNVITCSSSGSTTLQTAYGNDADGSDAIIALTTADDSLIFRNPAASGSDSTFILNLDQLANAATDALTITQAGTGVGISITSSNAGTTADAFKVSNNAGTITDAIDVSDSTGITNAINVGPNTILGTTAAIDLSNFDVSTAGTVTIAAGQSYTGSGAVTLSSGGSAALTLNSASDTLTIDSSDTTLSATGVTTFNCADCINFDDIADSTTLDANFVLAQGTNTYSQTFTGTTTTGFTYTAASLTTGTAFNIATTNTATSNTALSPIAFDITNAQATNANTNGIAGLSVNFTNNPSVAGNTEYAARIQNQVTSNATDNAVASLLLLNNADTSGTGSTVVTDALLITNSGAIAAGVVDAIDASDSTITNAINLGANFALFDGIRAFEGTTGTLTFEDTSGNDLATLTDNANTGDLALTGDLTVSGGDILSAATANLLNATSTTINFGGAATTALNIGNGAGNYTAINVGSGAGTHTINIAGTGATAADTINIGTGGTGADTITIGSTASTGSLTLNSGTGDINVNSNDDIIFNLLDNSTNGLDIQESTNNYINIDTTNSSENITLSTARATGGDALTFQGNSITTGTGVGIDANALTTGSALDVSSTSTALAAVGTGALGYFNWAPGSSTTASGDLFRINIGTNGTTSGNLFNVTDTGSSLFSVSETAVTSNLPTNFTSAGDVSMAYDLQFTNQTASTIRSKAPLYVEAGESFESNDLTLRTYNSGKIILDNVSGGYATLNFTAKSSTGDPATCSIGDVYFNSTDATIRACTAVNTWEALDNGTTGMTSFTAAGDTGSNQTISDGNTLSIAGGTNGIDTVGSATDIITLNLDTTEIGTTTFNAGASDPVWTFNTSGATDPTLTFANSSLTIGSAATIATDQTTLTLFNSTATTINFGGGATSALNIADAAITGTIDIGGVTADGASTVNIATNSTSADVITIGNSNASTTVAITGGDDYSLAATGVLTLSASAAQTTAILATDTDYTNFASIGDNNLIGTTAAIDFSNFDVATTGNVTVAAGVGLDTNAAGILTVGNTTATTVNMGGTAATAINIGAGGALTRAIAIGTGTGADTISIGTGGTGADTITIGNSASTTALNFTSGTGAQTFTSSNATGTTTASSFAFIDNSLTTGTEAYISSTSITQGKLLQLSSAANTLTSGTLFDVTTTSTGLTSGKLASFDWSPGSATSATGDLFNINIGTNGTTSGNLFSVSDTGSALFSVSEAGITSAVPHSFTASGDVSVAYDIQFTNQTSSSIKSNAPLTIDTGESFESNNLTLRTYGSGNVIVDLGTTAGKMSIGANITPQGLLHVSNTGTATMGKALAIFDQDESQPIISASASGTTVMTLTGGSGADLIVGADGTNTAANIGGNGVLVYGAVCVDDSLDNADDCIDASRAAGSINSITFATTIDDIAENFPSTDSTIEGADIVGLDYQAIPEGGSPDVYETEFVKKSTIADGNNVLGVISAKPGGLLGGWGQNIDPRSVKEVAVALSGRIPVKVTSQAGNINPGDLITVSDIPGVGMKLTSANQPIVGKALDKYENADTGSVGQVLVFVNTQWNKPTVAESSNASNSAQIADLEGRLGTLENDFNLKVNSSLTASTSGILASFDDVKTNSLMVLNDTVLSNTVINGTLNVGSMVFDNTDQSINAVGTLKIQSLALGNIELQGGLVTIDTTGNVVVNTITAQKYKVAGASAGTATLTAGETQILVTTEAVSADSLIFVTPKSAVSSPLSVTAKNPAVDFTVEIAAPSATDIEFDWFIVDKVN